MKPIAILLIAFCTFCELIHAAEFDKTFREQHLTSYAGHGFEWENNRIGISDEAPAPWESVKIDGSRVTLTHRRLEIGRRDGCASRIMVGISSMSSTLCSFVH
jgi:hypothetical protein